MSEYLAPIVRVKDACRSVGWYERIGFRIEFEHQFADGMPLYVGICRGAMRIHLSEHRGDARPGTLIYLYVDDVDAVAAALGVAHVDEMPWGRDFVVKDPDANRLRIGTVPEMARGIGD